MIAHAPFELAAESRRFHNVRREHGMPAVPFEAIATDEPGLAVLQVPEARDVEPARPAVIERVRLAHELLDQSSDTRSHYVLAEVVTDVPARVAEAVGMLRGARQQQQAGGFERRGGQDHHPPLGFVALAGHAVEEGDPARSPGVLVHQHLMDGGVGPHREVARVHRRIDEPGGRIEHGVDVAAAGPPIAGTPTVALAPVLVVLQAVRGDAGAVGRQDLSRFLQTLA